MPHLIENALWVSIYEVTIETEEASYENTGLLFFTVYITSQTTGSITRRKMFQQHIKREREEDRERHRDRQTERQRERLRLRQRETKN
jgi:hypothetical protein